MLASRPSPLLSRGPARQQQRCSGHCIAGGANRTGQSKVAWSGLGLGIARSGHVFRRVHTAAAVDPSGISELAAIAGLMPITQAELASTPLLSSSLSILSVTGANAPTFDEALAWLLAHPVYVVVGALAVLVVVPRVVKALIKYFALPAIVVLGLATVVLLPGETASALAYLLEAINTYPEAFSLITIGFVVLGLLPTIVSAAGVSGVIYLLLAALYSGEPEVKRMQAELAEVVAEGQAAIKTATKVFKWNYEAQKFLG